jgi:hypothetical protein
MSVNYIFPQNKKIIIHHVCLHLEGMVFFHKQKFIQLLDVILNKYTSFPQKKTHNQNKKIVSSKGWVKFEVETIVKVAFPSHSLFISSFFLLLPSLSITLSCSSSCRLFVFQAFILVSFLFHNIFLLWFNSLKTSLFPCLFLISRLLDEVELDRQGIEDLVNTNTRRYQGEVNNLTP